VSSVLRPRQHSIGYTGDGFYRSKDPTNSIKVLKDIYAPQSESNRTSSEAIYTVLFQRVAGASPLVNCSTAEGQQPKS